MYENPNVSTDYTEVDGSNRGEASAATINKCDSLGGKRCCIEGRTPSMADLSGVYLRQG